MDLHRDLFTASQGKKYVSVKQVIITSAHFEVQYAISTHELVRILVFFYTMTNNPLHPWNSDTSLMLPPW